VVWTLVLNSTTAASIGEPNATLSGAAIATPAIKCRYINSRTMSHCLNCGRELIGNENPPNICPGCRAAIIAQVQLQNTAPARRSLAVARSPVTAGIIGINALVYVAMVVSGVSPFAPNLADLLRWGANSGVQTLTAQPWRILTSNYVHIGLLHIVLNMWCLWNLGALAEQIFDRLTYFLTYTVCGLGGSIASLWWHPMGVGAGASGAIFGMAGALISALYLGNLPVHPQAMKSTLKSLLSFAGYNLFFGTVVPGIDNSAHIGGLISGLILGAVLARRLTSPPDERNSWRNWVFIAAGVILLLAFSLVRHATSRGATVHG
jgi:rhomboid protease GluP